MGALPRVSSVFELEVYKRAYGVSLDIHRSSIDFPKIEQYGGLADQMRRASKSICANLAEGWGKLGTDFERKRFLKMALGSATEMQVWLRYAKDLDYMRAEDSVAFECAYREICSMLFAMIGKVEA